MLSACLLRRPQTQWTMTSFRRFVSTTTKIPSFKNDHPRYNMPLFYGAMGNEDELNERLPDTKTEQLHEIREKAQKAVEDRNQKAFVKAGFDAVEWLGSLPGPAETNTDPRWFPRHHLCFTEDAPGTPILDTFFEDLYKTLCVEKPTHTGLAIQGVRGVGKTTILRLATLVASTVLPEQVVSVYVNYKTHRRKQPHVFSLLRDAAGLEKAPREDNIGCVLGEIEKSKRFAVVCADEVTETYETAIWDDLHGVADSFATVGLIADSSAKLPAMVEQSGHENKLRKWFPTFRREQLPQSLNDEKLRNVSLPPLTHRKQYEA